MQSAAFHVLMSSITARIAGRQLDAALESELNRAFPESSREYLEITAACRAGVAAGWMCSRGLENLRFGRVVTAGPATHGFSVDVVDMNSIVGPHHRHPNGEIDLVMPVTPDARFDGRGAGWIVYDPQSAHSPTVTNGRALVLYLLPEGKIEFTQTG